MNDERNWCWNDDKPAKANDGDCSVGIVRKMRNGIVDDDGCCGTCPYFMTKEDAEKEYTEKENRNKEYLAKLKSQGKECPHTGLRLYRDGTAECVTCHQKVDTIFKKIIHQSK